MLKAGKLGRESRLNRPESFQAIFKNAKRFRNLGLNALVCRNDLTFSRIGISIPKKQIPRAVDRNRIKRVIREKFRLRREELICHLDVVFLVYSTMLNLNNDEIRACLDFLWTKFTHFCQQA